MLSFAAILPVTSTPWPGGFWLYLGGALANGLLAFAACRWSYGMTVRRAAWLGLAAAAGWLAVTWAVFSVAPPQGPGTAGSA